MSSYCEARMFKGQVYMVIGEGEFLVDLRNSLLLLFKFDVENFEIQ